MGEPADHTHVVSNGKAELTLEDLAMLQPSLARFMLEIGERFWKCYHAAKAQNRRLARATSSPRGPSC